MCDVSECELEDTWKTKNFQSFLWSPFKVTGGIDWTRLVFFFLKRCFFLRPPRRDAVPLRCSLLRQTDWEKFGNVRKSFENSTSCHFTLRCFSPSPLPFSMRKLVFIPYTFIHLHTTIFGPVFLYSLLLKRLLKGSR